MTRENKLALVIGFGLILFVGILISDHFSTAHSQESADLRQSRGSDPLMQDRPINPRLFDISPNEPRDRESAQTRQALQPSPMAVNTGRIENDRPRESQDIRRISDDETHTRQDNVGRIVMGQPASPADSSVTFHSVSRGESLIAICRRYYDRDDRALVLAFAQFNGLGDPNQLRVGHRLRVPSIERLWNGETPPEAATPQTRDPQPEPKPVYTTHTVQRGETLSEISQKLLGTARRWRDIYEMNQESINDPNHVPAGTELKIPRP